MDGDLVLAEKLLNQHVNVNYANGYALCYATSVNFFRIVKMLLDYGANVHVKED